MGARDKAFGLVVFTPDKVQTNTGSDELLIAGEGMTVRVTLSQFIAQVDWPILATVYNEWRVEQDKIRKEKFQRERGNGEPLDISRNS